jgi:hypothetical protein
VLSAIFASPLAWPFAPLRPLFGAAAGIPPVDAIDAALAPSAGVRFVPAAPRPGRRRRGAAPPDPSAYDASIVERGEVPTRAGNAHDLANALVWATFPRSKRAHHARQLRAVRAAARPGRAWARSEEGDALAMLDEGGVVIVAAPGEVDEVDRDLRRGDDAALAARAREGRAVGVVFGHSIVEHWGRGEPVALAGLALALPGDPRAPDLRALDEVLAARITDRRAFLTRRGHGIASVRPDVLGTREVRA